MKRSHIEEVIDEEIAKVAGVHEGKDKMGVTIENITIKFTVSYTYDNEPEFHISSTKQEFVASG